MYTVLTVMQLWVAAFLGGIAWRSANYPLLSLIVIWVGKAVFDLYRALFKD